MAGIATAIPAYRRAVAEGAEEKGVQRLAKDPALNRTLAQFGVAVGKARDLKAALRDPRVLNVLLPALGLGDATGQAGLAARALTSNPNDPKSLVNQLSDPRWKAAATTLRLDQAGLAGLRSSKVQETLAEGLRSYQWRQGLDADSPGLADAVYFRENAANVTSVYGLLGDAVMRRVATAALGLPEGIVVQSVEAQARAVTARLKLSNLKDPKVVEKLAERYVVQRAQAAEAATASPLLSLFL